MGALCMVHHAAHVLYEVQQCLRFRLLVYTGERCLPDKVLEHSNCEQLVHGTYAKYRKVHFDTPRTYYWNYCLRRRISQWCSFAAPCLNQTSEWEKLCSGKFRWFWNSQFAISAVHDHVNGSYVRNIHVQYCGLNYLDWKTMRFTFSIRTTGFQYQPGKAINGKYKLTDSTLAL